MSGNKSRPDGTSGPDPSESAPSGGGFRRFDPPHPKPRLRSVNFVADDQLSQDPLDALPTPEFVGDVEDADTLACDRVADRLMSTQAAQLAEYLRSRQSDLVRRQQQLEEQQKTLQQARQAFETQRGQPEPPAPRTTDRERPDPNSDDAIRLLLETLEHQRLLHQAALTAAMRRDDTSVANPVVAAPPPPSATLPPTTAAPPPSTPRSGTPSTRAATMQEHEDQVARQTAATRQMLQEVRRVHQESLEVRMVTEQLWMQLAGQMPQDELSRSLQRLREQFQQHHRLAREELAAEQCENRELVARLEQQQLHLRRQRRDLQTWVDHRYQEFEQVAGQLIVRQQELDRQQRQFEQQRRQQEEELLQAQRQIKQLTAQLRCQEELRRVA